MARKVNKISITQQGGKISIYRNDELEKVYHMDKYMERIKEGKVTASGFGNFLAEIINDCLNCKTASSRLSDLDDLKQYYGTYFENIDQFAD